MFRVSWSIYHDENELITEYYFQILMENACDHKKLLNKNAGNV